MSEASPGNSADSDEEPRRFWGRVSKEEREREIERERINERDGGKGGGNNELEK